MDKLKKLSTNQLLGIVFVVLAIVATYPTWSSYLQINDGTPKEVDLSGYDMDKSQRVIITAKDAMVTLEQQNNQWSVNDMPASIQEITRFFESLDTVETESVVSENIENYAKFNVTEDTGTIIDISANTKEITFIVGKAGTAFDTFYMRNIDGSKVYLMKGTLSNFISTSPDTWRNKDIVNVDKDAIQRVEVSVANRTFVLSKENNNWFKEENGNKVELDDTKADIALKTFTPLSGTSFLSAEEVAEFGETPSSKIVVVTDQTTTITVIDKGSEYWIHRDGETTYYRLDKAILESLLAL